MNDYVEIRRESAVSKTSSDKTPSDKPAAAPERRISGRHVLFALVAFFAVVSGVNAVMMTIAIRTMPGVDVKSAYEASQHYNQELMRARQQQARGWKADIALGKGGDDRDVVLRMTDSKGAPVKGLSVQMRLAHPADRKADRTADLKEIAPGVYTATFHHVAVGVWDVVLDGREDGKEVYQSRSRVRL